MNGVSEEYRERLRHGVKDSVFTHLFGNKEYLLQLFQALHPEESGVTEDMLEIVTIENVLVDGIYNDLGFLVEDRLIILVEAQTTWSLNILPRTFLYLAKTYREYIEDGDIRVYGTRRVDLPRPELYVVYTGNKRIDKSVISLSEEFFGGEETDLEVKIHVISDGREGDIVGEYIAFTKALDSQIGTYGRTLEAVKSTIRICKDRNILRKYLSEHESEVNDLMVELFDQEWILDTYVNQRSEAIRASALEEGGTKRANESARRMLRSGFSPLDIATLLAMPVSEVNALKKQMGLK